MRMLVGFVVVVLLFSGCVNQRNLRKQQKVQRKIEQFRFDFPQLFFSDTSLVISKDTIVVVRELVSFDTIVGAADTVRVVKNNIITEVQSIRDTITKKVVQYRINTIVLPDTSYVERIDTFYTIREEIVTSTEYVERIPWWIWFIISILTVFLFYVILVKR